MKRWLVVLVGSLVVAGAAAAEAPAAPVPAREPWVKAACLKRCAGAPQGASGKVLLRCLALCESPGDAGAP